MGKSILLQTSTPTLGEVLANGKIYYVPPFQRDYSWRLENWEDLWSDVRALLQGDSQYHYMGSLVLQPRPEENTYWIIDGQQRLTTLSLLAAAVVRRLEDLAQQGVEPEQNRARQDLLRRQFLGHQDASSLLYKNKLHLNRRNNPLYQRYLSQLLPPPNPYSLTDSERLLRDAGNFFYERLGSLELCSNGELLSGLLSHEVANRLLFIQVLVQDELSAYTVFETLNTRLVALTATDLLKNYIFSLVPQGDVDLLHEQWLRTAGDVGEDRFPDFLRHYLMSTGELIRSDRLFKHLRSKIKSGQAAIELLDTLEREGAVYTALLEPSDERWRGNQEQRALVRALRVFQVRQLLPVLMAAYRRLGNSNFQSVLRLGCVLSFRYHVIGGLNPNELEEVYVKASGRLEAGEIKMPAQLFSALSAVYVSDEQFQNDFAYASIRPARKKKLLKYILCELERDASGVPRDFEEDEGCLEHILPEKPCPGWEASFSARQHADFVGRLGNYTLLEPTLNREAGNLTFEQKRELYARSQYALTRQLAELPEWTPEALESRQRRLAGRATHVWRVDYASGG